MRNLVPICVEDIEQTANDRVKIRAMRDGIRAGFSDFFNTHGFTRHEAGRIIPEHDESVLFTGSTISTFKPYLEKQNVPSNGLFMIQSCLRTQNTKILKDDSKRPQWASYFSSIGALTTYDNLDEISKLTWLFYTDFLGIPEDKMRVRIASKDIDLLSHWKKAALNDRLEHDANNPVYYTHKFGMESVSGRNCNLAVVDHRTQELRDIGNIIVIERAGEPIAVEIAFGVETIVSRLLGFPNPIAASLIADIVPVKNEYSLKLADAISSSVVILDSGERPVATNRGRVLRKYMQAIGDYREKAAVTLDEIEKFASDFEKEEFGKVTSIPSKIREYVSAYEHLKRRGLGVEEVNKELSSIIPLENQTGIISPRMPLSSQLVMG